MPEIKEAPVYTTAKKFSDDYKVPISTIYYMLNREYVKLRMVSTTYGKRKKFDEGEMKAKLESRKLL